MSAVTGTAIRNSKFHFLKGCNKRNASHISRSLPSENNFLAAEEIFEEHKRMASLWFTDDSVWSTRPLIKRNSFNRIGKSYPLVLKFSQKAYI